MGEGVSCNSHHKTMANFPAKKSDKKSLVREGRCWWAIVGWGKGEGVILIRRNSFYVHPEK